MRSPGPGDGVLLVSKPPGVTSHDVVERIRRSRLGQGAKVGHAGTLDPFATGLLLTLVGRATRVQRYLTALPKSYRATAGFGIISDTGDPTGRLEATGTRVSEGDVRAVLPGLSGEIRQRVPLTSAVKVGGERLYRKARRGEQVSTPVRTVHISRLELVRFDEQAQTGELEIDCSSGTYVRQLVADLGRLCGAGAHCGALERVAIGPFGLDQADEGRLIPLSEALGFLPERPLGPEEVRVARNGGAVPAGAEAGTEGSGPMRLTSGDELIAVAEHRGGRLKPVTVL